jgi:hypothetical protein
MEAAVVLANNQLQCSSFASNGQLRLIKWHASGFEQKQTNGRKEVEGHRQA